MTSPAGAQVSVSAVVGGVSVGTQRCPRSFLPSDLRGLSPEREQLVHAPPWKKERRAQGSFEMIKNSNPSALPLPKCAVRSIILLFVYSRGVHCF